MVLKYGDRVSRLARNFDIRGELSWSQTTFPNTWRTQVLFGTIDEVCGRNVYWVRWDFDKERSEHHRRAFTVVEEDEFEDDASHDASGMSGTDAFDVDSLSGSNVSVPDSPRSSFSQAAAATAPLGTVPTAPVPVPLLAPGVVEVGPKNGKVLWEKIDDIHVNNRREANDQPRLLGIDMGSATPLSVFLHFIPLSIHGFIEAINNNGRESRRKKGSRPWSAVSEGEFLVWLSLFIAKSTMPKDSIRSMWDEEAHGLFPAPNFGRYMKLYRFRDIMSAMSCVTYSASASMTDPWWKVRPLIQGFNENRRKSFHSSWLVCIDESMSAYRGDDLPHTSFIQRKPEPVGTELTTMCDRVSKIMVFMELQEGKAAMALKPFHNDLGATAACTKRMIVIGGLEGSGKVAVVDSWFASRKTLLALHDVGVYMIGNIKTAHACFPKSCLWTDCRQLVRGDHVVYRGVTDSTNGVYVCAIGWKCGETKTTMTLICNCDTTIDGTPAQVERQDQFGNATKILFKRPHVVETYNTASGAVDYHNRVRQGDLALEKKWVTAKWEFRLFTTVIGICVTDAFLASGHFLPHQFENYTPRDFVATLTSEMMRKGQGAILLSCPTTMIVETPVCVLQKYPRKPYTNRITGESYTHQTTRRYGICNMWTSYYCDTCGVNVCTFVNTGRNCDQQHFLEPSARSKIRKRKAK